MIDGRSSDLSLLANAFPEWMFQWLGVIFATYRGDLQQRVLSGIFTPVPFSCVLPDGYTQTNRGQR